jgi:hypothetical protein
MAGDAHVMEMSGLYGPYSCHERVLQRVWAEREFMPQGAVASDGRAVEVLEVGRWNKLGGPDFIGAKLRLGGETVCGDVEVHFRAEDWDAHGHPTNAAYAKVVLHVVLFPPAKGRGFVRRSDGARVPALALLPLLLRDLEEIASDEALRALTGRLDAGAWDDLLALSLEERGAALQQQARQRWDLRVRFARLRIAQLGWDSAAHQTAMEVLGYRANRAQMLLLSARHPLPWWAGGDSPQRAYDELVGQWSLQGLRPANHPRERLRQYSRWAAAVPDWPEKLGAMAKHFTGSPAVRTGAVAAQRVELKLPELGRRISADVVGGAVTGARFDNLVCDGFLPLLAAKAGCDCFAHWFCWPLGDVPDALKSAMRELALASGRSRPSCHGWGQGLLGWAIRP